jgi:hypothetical protein
MNLTKTRKKKVKPTKLANQTPLRLITYFLKSFFIYLYDNKNKRLQNRALTLYRDFFLERNNLIENKIKKL